MIIIKPALLAEIEAAATKSYPEESCGLVIGHGNNDDGVVVTGVQISPNLSEHDRNSSFEIDPQLRFDVMRKLHGGPERIVGHFHSHPNGPAQPSTRDSDQVWEPDLVWIITSISNSRLGQTNAYLFDDATQAFRPLDIHVEA